MKNSEPFIVEYRRIHDERGYFSTPFTTSTLSLLNTEEVYISLAQTEIAHTIRGMHYQEDPYSESKLLTLVRGSILDILIDLSTLGNREIKIHTFELEADRPQVLYIPKGYAHGYQTLSDKTEILYALDSRYQPTATRGFSPLSFELMKLWPFKPTLIKKGDLQWPMISR